MHSQVKKKKERNTHGSPSANCSALEEGLSPGLSRSGVNEGRQEPELTVAVAPADANTIPAGEGTGSWTQPTEAGPGRGPDTPRALTGLLPIPASEGRSDSWRSLGGAVVRSPTAPWHREEVPQIFRVP